MKRNELGIFSSIFSTLVYEVNIRHKIHHTNELSNINSAFQSSCLGALAVTLKATGNYSEFD